MRGKVEITLDGVHFIDLKVLSHPFGEKGVSIDGSRELTDVKRDLHKRGNGTRRIIKNNQSELK